MGRKITVFFAVILLIVILICFLRFLFVMSWIHNAEVDYKIVPIDVFSLFISSALTIWIGWYIAKKITEQRFEKEFLIKDLSQIELDICEIETIFRTSGNVDVSYITSKNHRIQLLHGRLLKTMNLMGLSSIIPNDLGLKIRTLYQKTTDFNPEDIDVQEIYTVCDETVLEVRGLIISINNR